MNPLALFRHDCVFHDMLFEEYEAQENQRLVTFFENIEKMIVGEGQVDGLAGEIVREFLPLLNRPETSSHSRRDQ